MSAQPKTQISIDELVARASELKSQVEAVGSMLNTYLNQYRELQLAYETLKNLPDIISQGYIVLDRLSTVLVPTRIDEGWTSKVLLNLGLGYYIKTTRDKALEVLEKKIKEAEKVISNIQAHHQRLLREYIAIQRLLSQAIESQQTQ